MDKLTVSERSVVMSRVRSKDSKPEMVVRSLVHRMGFRFRLHSNRLQGCPDLVFSGRRKIIFVHGCFWHGHHCRAGRNRPTSRKDYWDAKLERNVERDRLNLAQLRREGWSVLAVWECQTRERDRLARRLKAFLETK
jgi:DNA mismatch endonuclease (patch repair protein)